MPGWKRDTGAAVDRVVTAALPGVAKAVKWNSPFYGRVPGEWFLSFHCFDRYVKLAFLTGAALIPLPPVGSKQPRVRYLHLHEGDLLDEAQLAEWVAQAAALPGERM